MKTKRPAKPPRPAEPCTCSCHQYPPVKVPARKFNLPDIKKCNLECLWFEKERGRSIKKLSRRQMQKGLCPDVKKWPIAASCFPLEIQTVYYRRRKDGGYGGGDIIMRSVHGVSSELAFALCWKYFGIAGLGMALRVAATACERCMNILAHQCGLSWGYSGDSEQAAKCGTSCDLCR